MVEHGVSNFGLERDIYDDSRISISYHMTKVIVTYPEKRKQLQKIKIASNVHKWREGDFLLENKCIS
jgi:hypothetical protein